MPVFFEILSRKLNSYFRNLLIFLLVIFFIYVFLFPLSSLTTKYSLFHQFKDKEQYEANSFKTKNFNIASQMNLLLKHYPLVAMGDRAGSFAYFYKGSVLQLEGIVGDLHLLNAIKTNTPLSYLTNFNLEYLISYNNLPNQYMDYNIFTPLPQLSLGPYSVLKVCSDREFFRSPIRHYYIIIWNWPSCLND